MTKKLLLIAPVFFGYYKDMIKEAKKMGYHVDYICDSPSNSNFFKALNRLDQKISNILSYKYFKNEVLPKIKNNDYDNVLVIGGMTFSLTPNMLEKMRFFNRKAVFSLYQWDSEKNLSYSTKIHKYFDRIFTFDRSDALKKNKVYRFLPLFYNDTYQKISQTKKYSYDCMYVGTAHPKKFHDINEMSAKLKPIFKKQFIYHYMPSKLKYVYHKLLSPEYKKAKYSDFKFKKIPSKELINLISKSKCVLDAPQAGQTGLTIRTIECLGAKRKIITTNKDIINYDFYSPQNIYVYDGKFDYKSVFFKSDYHEIDPKIYKKYSLKNWLKILLE